MDNSEFLKTFLSLIKVYDQYGGIFRYNEAFANELEKEVQERMQAKTGTDKKDMRKAIKVELREKVITTALVKRADRKRYKELITSIGHDYALGTNMYPDTINKALTALNAFQSPNWAPRRGQPNRREGHTFLQEGGGGDDTPVL